MIANKTHTSQVPRKNNSLDNKVFLKPNQILEIIYKSSDNARRILKQVVNDNVNSGGPSYRSQESFAKKAGCARETANINIRKLCATGAIVTRRRMNGNVSTSNLTEANFDLYDNSSWQLLREFFPIFKHLYYERIYADYQPNGETSHNIIKEFNLLNIDNRFDNRFDYDFKKSFVYGKGNTIKGDMMKSNFDFSTIDNLSTLKLTEAGRFKLAAFPKDVLIEADKRLAYKIKNGTKIDEPYRYFVKIANQICKDNNYKINYKISFDLFADGNIEDQLPYCTGLKNVQQSNRTRDLIEKHFDVTDKSIRFDKKCDCNGNGHPDKHWTCDPSIHNPDLKETQSAKPDWYQDLNERPKNNERDPIVEAKRIKDMHDSGYFEPLVTLLGKEAVEKYVKRSIAAWLDKIPPIEE